MILQIDGSMLIAQKYIFKKVFLKPFINVKKRERKQQKRKPYINSVV